MNGYPRFGWVDILRFQQQWYLIILGLSACILFSCLFQERVMKRDRLNRIFYMYVIKDENTKNDYLKLDSLINIRGY